MLILWIEKRSANDKKVIKRLKFRQVIVSIIINRKGGKQISVYLDYFSCQEFQTNCSYIIVTNGSKYLCNMKYPDVNLLLILLIKNLPVNYNNIIKTYESILYQGN